MWNPPEHLMIFILNINYQILADFSLADNAPGPIIGNFYQRLQYIGTTFDYGTMLVGHALKELVLPVSSA